MRKSFDTLAALVREQLKRDVLDGAVVVFVGRVACRPGSGLAVAIGYMSRRWSKATLFLEHPTCRSTTMAPSALSAAS